MPVQQSTSEVVITGAEVRLGDGRLAATVDAVEIGGGTRTVTVDGVQEERTSDLRRVYHVRFIAPDRMLSDELREAATYEAAVELGQAYAAKLVEHGERVAELAGDLTV